MDDLINKYFPDGCTECGGIVVLDKLNFFYRCTSPNCLAYADCHRNTGVEFQIYQPTETLAKEEIHILRKTLRNLVSKMYFDKIKVINNTNFNATAPINIIYIDNIVRYFTGSRNIFVKKLYEKETCVVEMLETKEEMYVESRKISNASNRSKTLIWLALKLKIPIDKFTIGYLSKSNLVKAIKLTKKHYLKAIMMSLET